MNILIINQLVNNKVKKKVINSNRRYDGICPECKVSPKSDKYCKPCKSKRDEIRYLRKLEVKNDK